MGLIVKKVEKKVILKKLTGKYRPMIRSRHPSHSRLRYEMEKLPFRSVVRLGSLTDLTDLASLKGERVELNSKEAIRNSSSKFRMKECFSTVGVNTAQWYMFNGTKFQDRSIKSESEDFDVDPMDLQYPIVAKHFFGSRGTGNYLLKSKKELDDWKIGKELKNYLFERFINYNKEYRLHCTKNGCFYSCRKMLKTEFKDHPNAWQRHDDNSVWILEENENFEKPVNWDEIVKHCTNAVTSCGLDFGACDLRVQNNKNENGEVRKNCDFIVIEVNSAPSFGEVTIEKYKKELISLLKEKHNARN